MATTLSGYLVAADNHNIGNDRTSWLDPETYTSAISSIGKFAATSILSGANSFYNSAAYVGEWAGFGAKQNDTQTWISSLDSDLGAYYRNNQDAVDLGGFVLGSLIPGLAGIKTLHAGQAALQGAKQTGFLGANLGRATGLLAPNTQKYIALATADLNASTTAIKLLNVNTAKAIGAGLWQNTLEAAAFETLVQATMFKSPVLEQQDLGDIGANILLGGLIGGALGGAFNTARVFGQLKQAVRAEDLQRFPFQARMGLAEATTPSETIVLRSYEADTALRPNFATSNYDVKTTLTEGKITKSLQDTRSAINDLAKGDTDLGNYVASISQPVLKEGLPIQGFSQGYFENFSGAIRVLRQNETSVEESLMSAALREGKVPTREVAARWVKLTGEDTGKVLADNPGMPSFGDSFKSIKEIHAKIQGDYKFSQKLLGGDADQWSALGLKGAGAYREAEARYIWAHKILKEVPVGATVNRYDIPLLERAYLDNQLRINVVSGQGPTLETLTIGSREDLYRIIKESKEEVANQMLYKLSIGPKDGLPIEQGTEAAARIANTKQSYLEGTKSADEFGDLFAIQAASKEKQAALDARGISKSTPEYTTDPIYLPRYAKVVYDISADIKAVRENVVDAMVLYKEQQKLYQEGAGRVVAKNLGPIAESLPEISDRALLSASRTGSGAGLLTNENSNYGTIGSTMAFIGSITRQIKQNFRKATSDSLEAPLVSLGAKPEAAFEFESLNQKISRTGKLFVLREDTLGNQVLVDRALLKDQAEDLGAAGIVDYELLEDGVNSFRIQNEETLQAVRAHISTSGKRTQANREIHSQQGKTDSKDPEVFRPIRPDLRKYPHFAFVLDEAVTGSGHKTMIHAASEKELAQLIDRVPSRYRVLTKQDSEEFFKARHEYEYSRTLNENYINSDLASNGVFSNFFPKSDPTKIIDDILQQHYRESDTLAMELIRLKYESQFSLLEDLGKQYSKVDTSRFASRIETLEKSADNPYFNYIKTALDISKINEYPLIYSANKLLDTAVSRANAGIRAVWDTSVKTPQDLDKINTLLDRYGMKPAYYDSALQALANHSAPQGVLTSFVRRANSLLSLFTLGLDPLNALNNAIGSNILRTTELRHLTQAIQKGDTKIAGELAALSQINLPGVDAKILAPSKLMGAAIKNFWDDKRGAGSLIQRYKDMGLIRDRVEQLKMLVDDFTLRGNETVAELNTRMAAGFEKAKALTEKAEGLTGNPLAEEFNRFVSANVMDQLTGIAVRAGKMTQGEANAYINTFVNRVEGNIVASQRPLIFQGPIGQAISLFQSYQFNLLQQLFRYVAEGSKKDLAMLAGLQSTLYGIQSLPAFQFMNVHIIGQMSGNKEHRDSYDAVYGTVGRTAGDFVLYGLPSNILQTNIYSRGDINPRHITILPTSLQEIPIVQGWGKLLGSLYETFGKIKGGGDVWESFLQGVEHNGISRPLAGFAQTLQAFGPQGQAYSTSSKGTILYSNDLLSLASLTRLAGGRPLDEAVVNDAMFRVKTYEAARRQDMLSLSERIKGTLIQGNEPDEGQILSFAQRYAELGGKQAGFNKWMMDLYKSANTPQAEKLQGSLSNPFFYKLQLLMGGDHE